ncbi:hypothetical protein WMF28_00770 [Sorangium sp. So ce590]|uniref:hypothetical protein n=1 Tax=Sorangium sp. So ce590 TaxID=3133317 RepID=UPI003F6243B7
MSDGTHSGRRQAPNKRPPHPATVAQPKAPHLASAPGKGRPPHPATVAQPKAPRLASAPGKGRPPHPATVAQPKAPRLASAPGKGRPPHPATVAQPKAPRLASAPGKGRPPHPATVAQPKAPHQALIARSPVAQRAEATYDVATWKFTAFKAHLAANDKLDNEDWDAYKNRILGAFRNYDPGRQAKFFDNAVTARQQVWKQKQSTRSPKKPSKETLWSSAFRYNDNSKRWTPATHTKPKQNANRRTTTNKHAEQSLFSTMQLPTTSGWIGFVQNEWPCKGEGCCSFFIGVSKLDNVAGVVFTVQGSGGYATEHGREIGSSGHVYFCDGNMTYDPPPGAPDPPP